MTSPTIAITTRNRPDALVRCIESLRAVERACGVLVYDDGSVPPVCETSLQAVAGTLPIRVIRDVDGRGYIAGRNRLVREAESAYVLLMDDDTRVLGPAAVRRACRVLDDDPSVGAVAFAQAEADGRPWPASMQPGRADAPAVVPCFTGFAHLVRKAVFERLGGYLEPLVFYGEEKNLCMRLLDAGFRVVYLPDALIAHIPDPSGRSASRYVRYAIRNDLLTSVHVEPWPLALAAAPVRLWRYTRMAATIAGGDAGGLRWIVGEVIAAFPSVWRTRRAVRWSTLRTWRRLAQQPPRYVTPAGAVP